MACGGGTQRAMDAVEARSDQTAAEITKAVVARRLRRRHRLAEGSCLQPSTKTYQNQTTLLRGSQPHPLLRLPRPAEKVNPASNASRYVPMHNRRRRRRRRSHTDLVVAALAGLGLRLQLLDPVLSLFGLDLKCLQP